MIATALNHMKIKQYPRKAAGITSSVAHVPSDDRAPVSNIAVKVQRYQRSGSALQFILAQAYGEQSYTIVNKAFITEYLLEASKRMVIRLSFRREELALNTTVGRVHTGSTMSFIVS